MRPDAFSLAGLYGPDIKRTDTYEAMVERVMAGVRAGRKVCFAVPGHPGVLASPTHEAIRRARAEGFEALMLPALSSIDHFYADAGVDPGSSGSMSLDATDFLVYGFAVNLSLGLILWQIGAIGNECGGRTVNRRGLELLARTLLESYPVDHELIVYEAARYAMADPVIMRLRLDELGSAPVPLASTLYVPPATRAEPLTARLELLGIAGA